MRLILSSQKNESRMMSVVRLFLQAPFQCTRKHPVLRYCETLPRKYSGLVNVHRGENRTRTVDTTHGIYPAVKHAGSHTVLGNRN